MVKNDDFRQKITKNGQKSLFFHRFSIPKKTQEDGKIEENFVFDPEIHSPINDKNYT